MMHSGAGVPTMAYYSYSNQNSPAVETANKENPFDFPSVNLPPRLKNIGRKISQMSNDFLPTEEDTTSRKVQLERRRSHEKEVPGMGDEPVMCPFCNKPLPPSLLASQLLSGKHDHNHHNQNNRPSNVRRASSMRVSSNTSSPRITPSAPLSRVPSASTPPAKPPLLDALPVKTPEPAASKAVEEPLPSATSETFAATVKEGDVANHDAAEKMITEEDIKRWSTLSGISITKTSSTAVKPTEPTTIVSPIPKPLEDKKAFPLLPPPPPAASKLTKPPPTDRPSSTSSSKFNLFGENKTDAAEEDESDDEGVATGYTKLTGPASDSEDEGESKKRVEEKAEEPKEPEPNDTTEEKETPVDASSPGSNYSALAEEQKSAEVVATADPNEVKKVLQEVLGRVNELSKSQAALLASHSTLLTSLKIARSNLAMAEANSEMLEAQLKRTSATSAASKAGTSRNVSGPATTTPGTPQLSATASRSSADHIRATTTSNSVASPASAARTPARVSLEERTRPTSLHITANELAGAGGLTAPSPGGLSSTSNSNSWGFWNGGKKKVTGALSHVHVPSASSVIDAFQQPSRPGTPNPDGQPRKSTDSISNWIPTSPAAPYSVPLPGANARPLPNRTATHQAVLSKSLNEQPSLSRSMSVMNVPSMASQRSVSARTSSTVSNEELSTLRQAYSAAVAKMDGMSKELAELKKGKVEMEAELENLSQALFEEANKMVADERRRVAELEDSLKEVKEEREALRETIKVLGGKVEDIPQISHTHPEEDKEESNKVEEERDGDEEEEMFRPRDLDKHYAALRKSIHHVASGADLHEDEDEEEAEGRPLVSEPAPLTPSLGNSISLGLEVPSTRSSTGLTEEDIERPLSRSMPSLPAAAENNPWATVAPSSPPRINVKAATPSPHIPLGGLPDLPSDQAGEGEAPSGLGLEVDKGLVEGAVGGAEEKRVDND
ncbi:uncharacterized protein L199_000474 [Kwoniella botswanensis]|uniref:uncharacterized protein n=1 Tax=Kwoniella botswanensis TaxID=1268659 RepID=UPI00315D3192